LALLGFGSGFTDTDFFDPANWPATFTPGPNSGCVAFNPFDPHASQKAAIAFITHNTHVLGVITQHVVNGYISGDFDQVKDWGMDGPLSVVIGGEYRKETSKSTPDAFTQQDLTFDSGTQPVAGSFDVKEFFAEVSLPVMLNRSFAKELSFDAAIRQSSYSTAGDSTSWKFGGIFSPVDGLKFRATEAYAVRAPNIGELFAPQQRLFSNVTDPCTDTAVNAGTSFRPANCVALLAALGVPYVPGVTQLDTGATTATLVGGNPLLTPEEARTTTFGVVIQPPQQDFVFTIDYYDITIRNAILAPTGQSVANECVDLTTINNPFCALITRSGLAAVFPGTISQISVTQLNVAAFETDGIDFTATYHKETRDWFGEDYGSLDFHLIGNYLDKLTFTALPGQAPVESANTFQGGIDGQPAPRWQTNLDTLWTYGDWQVDYNIDWYSAVLSATRQTFESVPNQVAPQFKYIPDHFVQNVQVDYTVVPGWTAYAGINNLFYQKPSIGQQFLPVDPLGRFFYVGLQVNTGLPDIDL
jgi:outer membrane receptor protein involved in Fe transport